MELRLLPRVVAVVGKTAVVDGVVVEAVAVGQRAARRRAGRRLPARRIPSGRKLPAPRETGRKVRVPSRRRVYKSVGLRPNVPSSSIHSSSAVSDPSSPRAPRLAPRGAARSAVRAVRVPSAAPVSGVNAPTV